MSLPSHHSSVLMEMLQASALIETVVPQAVSRTMKITDNDGMPQIRETDSKWRRTFDVFFLYLFRSLDGNAKGFNSFRYSSTINFLIYHRDDYNGERAEDCEAD